MALRLLVVFSIVASSLVTAAHAQERAWFLSETRITEVRVTAGGLEWTPTATINLPAHSPINPVLWRGGRYILWIAKRPDGQWFARFDTRSRQIAAFPIDFVPYAMEVDRSRGQLAVVAPSVLLLVDPEKLQILNETPLPSPEPNEERSLAVASGRIFVGRHTPDDSVSEVLVFDTGVFPGPLELLTTIPGPWHVKASRDETRVYLQAGSPPEVQVWSPGTLTPISTGTAENFVYAVGNIMASALRIPGMFSTGVSVAAYDRDTLAKTFQANIDVYGRPLSGDYVLELQQASHRSPIVLRSHTNEYGVDFRVMHIFDGRTRTYLRTLRDAPFDVRGSTMLMLAPPDPLAYPNVVVNLTTRSAGVTWPDSPNVGDYQVIVGSAPGRSDIGTFSTGGFPHVIFRGIPSGTFYVRVKAINEAGAFESPEREVFIP
jgi:hypothetical protein